MIKTTTDTKTLEGIAVEYYNKALHLGEELQAVGFNDLRIKKTDNDWCGYDLLLTEGDNTFRVSRDYKGKVCVSLHPYRYYSNVSTSKRSEVYKETIKSNAVKVITKKKVDALIQEEVLYHTTMEQLNSEALDTIAQYLAKIKELESEYNVEYSYNGHTEYNSDTDRYKQIKTTIRSGTIEHNGIRFEFNIDYSSGYIKEDVTVCYLYSGNDKIDAFKKLSDNKYTGHKN